MQAREEGLYRGGGGRGGGYNRMYFCIQLDGPYTRGGGGYKGNLTVL